MKKNLPNNKLSIIQIICFSLIGIVCIAAILEAVYVVIFSVDGTLENVTTSVTNEVETDEKEILKDNFLAIFENNLVSNIDTVNIPKKDQKYDLVYADYSKTDKVIGKYDLNVQLPHINIDSEEVTKINNEIDKTFKEKAESLIDENNDVENAVYNIKYQAYLNNDILSLVLKCTLKENTNAQRIIIKTYNYNIKTEKRLEIEDLTEIMQINKNQVENKIKQEINSQISMEKSLEEAGYEVFKRYPDGEMYKFDNLSNFFIDEQNNLYIIFAYGNANNTSEMDIVVL